MGHTERKQVQICLGLLAWQLGKPPPSLFLPNPPAFSRLLEHTSCSPRALFPLLGLNVSPMTAHLRSCEPGLYQAFDELSSSSDCHCLTCLLVT